MSTKSRFFIYSIYLLSLLLSHTQASAQGIDIEAEIAKTQSECDSLSSRATSPEEKAQVNKLIIYLDLLRHMIANGEKILLTGPRSASPSCLEIPAAPRSLRISAPMGSPDIHSSKPSPSGITPLTVGLSPFQLSPPPYHAPTDYEYQPPAIDLLSLDPEKKRHILEIINHITLLYGSQFSGQQIFELYRYIEEGRPKWKSGSPIAPFYFKENEKPFKQHAVRFGVGARGQLYIHFEKSSFGSGAAKILQQVTSYETWERHAHLSPHSPDYRSYLMKEQQVAKTIHAASENGLPTRGLVETTDVSPGHFTIQKLYDGDLFPYITQDPTIGPSTIPKDRKLVIISDVGEGIKNLHNLGYVHGDIKPENILIENDKTIPTEKGLPIRAVLADFDTTYMPQSLIDADRNRDRISYTTIYAAPELLEFADRIRDDYWIGDSNQAKVKNAKKSDVFALGTVTQMFLNGRRSALWAAPDSWPAKGKCTPATVHNTSEFLECQNKFLIDFQTHLAKSPNYDPLAHLVAQSVQINPEDRLDSEEFYQALQHIKSRAGHNLSDSGISMQEYKKNYSHLAEYTPATLNSTEIEAKLNGKPEKSYIISPEDTGKGIALRLSFVGAKVEGAFASIRSQVLDLDPQNPIELEKELHYLKLIHVLN